MTPVFPRAIPTRLFSTLALLVLTVPVLGGCKNPCQSLCRDMAALAEDCGYTVDNDALQSCFDDQARSETTKEDRQSCNEFDQDLTGWWDCEDVGRYFSSNDTGE
jgi:hypothetical protein